MTAPTHVVAQAALTAPIGGAALSAVQLMPAGPGADLFPSLATFPGGTTYVAVGLCGAVLTAQPLAVSAIQYI